MRKVVLDAETFFSTQYSLRKMTPPEYILGSEYETIGWGVKIDNRPPVWLEGDKVAALLRAIDEPWVYIGHNLIFDASIIAFRYNIYPALYVDTMSMARALISHKLPGARVSLDNVGAYFGMEKGKALANVKGLRLSEIRDNYAELYKPLADYCLQDVAITRVIYDKLSEQFPLREYMVNDMVIRMATQPQFAVDLPLLEEHLSDVQAAKATLLGRAGVTKMQLMSGEHFATCLRALGVEPETKPSPTDPAKQTYAFAKSDTFMDELLAHDNLDVQALAAARVGLKSTLEETRTQHFINIARLTPESKMPIALRYSGAHTHRFSGDWKLNQQNLPSRKGRKLRQSLRAPPGHVILASDASQIEARLTAWLAGQESLVFQFANGDDVYSLFASELYYREITKKDKVERFLGKTAILGLGFGMGAGKFANTVRIAAADQGIEIDLDALGGADKVVATYRTRYPQIPACWRRLERVLSTMTEPHSEQREMFGPCLIRHESLVLPTGLKLNYHDLRYEDGPGWSYWNGRMRKSIWGGTLLENVVQALDRVVVIDAALRIEARMRHLGLHMPLAHQMHDELVYVPREQDVDVARAIVDEEMARRPVWGPDLPLASESKAGWTFGDMG